MKRSPMPRSTKPLKRVPLNRVNRIKPKKRSASEFRRIYHSVERVRFVEAMGCLVCQARAQGHHIENEGMSRKAHYTKIVPLCPTHHDELHHGWMTFSLKYNVNLAAQAYLTERLWKQFNEQEATE